MATHPTLGGQYNHAVHRWTAADEAARLSIGDLVETDLGKVCWQQNDDSLWLLTAVSPAMVWKQIGNSDLGDAAALNVGMEPGNLVPLSEDGKFPAEVLPELGADLNVQVFNASGTFTAPKAGNYRVRVQGGGQGGGGASTNSGASSAPGGGGRGGFCAFGVELVENEEVTVTVGSGGSATATTTGGSGGLSSFGVYGLARGGGANTACSIAASAKKLANASSHTKNSTPVGEDSFIGGGCITSSVPATFGGGGLSLLGSSQTYGTSGGPGLVTIEWA